MDALLRTPIVYDIEMVDTWLFCYTQSQQDLTNPATWRLLETIANGVLGSLTPVVGRYSDSRALGRDCRERRLRAGNPRSGRPAANGCGAG